MDPHEGYAIVFSFTSLNYEEPYLKKISKAVEYFKSGCNISIPEQDPREEDPWYKISDLFKVVNNSHCLLKSNISTPEQDLGEEVPWYKRPDVWDNLHLSRSVFNKIPFKNKVISFISDPDHPGASVRGYRNAVLKNPHLNLMKSV